jgi:o-succinylbenzoate---CoA ligase
MEDLVRAVRAALAAGRPYALSDPAWPPAWRERMTDCLRRWPGGGAILIPTSGSSGIPKFCIHDLDTLQTAARGFAELFGPRGVIHAVSVLPRHHVGGLMPLLRCAAMGGRVHHADYRDPESIAAAPFPLEQAALSLVPTQLRRMMDEPAGAGILRRMGLILAGGAHCPEDVLIRSRQMALRLAPCYGMTETAAMVTLLEPEAFLAGAGGVGPPLPHARVELDWEGRVLIRSEANLRGYFPERAGFRRQPFATGDIGRMDAAGGLHLLGRADRMIVSGGENIHPEQVEAALLSTGLVTGACCEGVPDPDWGARVEAWVTPAAGAEALDTAALGDALAPLLPRHAIPKAFHRAKETADRNAMGKRRDHS